jgi:hypothetical protein
LSAYRAIIAATSAKETLSEVVVEGGMRETVNGSGVTNSQGDSSFALQAAGQSVDTVVDNGTLYLKIPATSTGRALHLHTLSLAQFECDHQGEVGRELSSTRF